VGLIFYLQLKNLIEPLTPQSIPQSIKRLENVTNRSNYIYRLIYQQQLVQFNLESYVATNQLTALQDFYMNQADLDQFTTKSKQFDLALWNKLAAPYFIMQSAWSQIVSAMQQGNQQAAKNIITSQRYFSAMQNFRNILNTYYQSYDAISNESSFVTVKLATKNTIKTLEDSLNKTMIIFLDAIIVSILLAFFWARTISRPINKLRDDMKRITSENLDIPLQINVTNNSGEIGELTHAYIALINNLRNTTVSRDKLLLEIERRKQSEENLRQTSILLEESNRELDQFAFSASHDLRAPLQGIETLSEWIIKDCYDLLPEDSRKNLDLIKKRVHRLDAFIDGILQYARIRGPTTQPEIIDINKLLEGIIDNLSPPESIKVVIDKIMPTLTTDIAALTQVFLNLINNAIKFNKNAQGNINIGHDVAGDFYKFYVSDNGPGIDIQFHEKIFEMFHTLQSRDIIDSAGIGLAIVKKIVEKHGGTISVKSAPGQGTTFYFTWPQ
jgi:signal transduction histidine kinase